MLEQSEGGLGDMAVLEGGGERTVEDEEEIGVLAGGKAYWKLEKELIGEGQSFCIWWLSLACIDCAGSSMFRII